MASLAIPNWVLASVTLAQALFAGRWCVVKAKSVVVRVATTSRLAVGFSEEATDALRAFARPHHRTISAGPRQMRRPKRFDASLRPAAEACVAEETVPQPPCRREVGDLLRRAPTTEAGIANAQTLPRPTGEELWNIKTVVQKTGLSRASIYRYVRRNLFPPRCRLGPGRIGWLASEVVAWMHSRPRPNT